MSRYAKLGVSAGMTIVLMAVVVVICGAIRVLMDDSYPSAGGGKVFGVIGFLIVGAGMLFFFQ